MESLDRKMDTFVSMKVYFSINIIDLKSKEKKKRKVQINNTSDIRTIFNNYIII